jgi:hypothetical protein
VRPAWGSRLRRRPSPKLYARRRRGELRLARSAGGAVDLAGRKARLAGGELDVNRAELGGMAGTAERGLAAELFQLLHRGAAGHLQRSPDRPRGHAVEPGTNSPLHRTVDDGLVLRFTARPDKKDNPRLKAFIQVFNSPEVKQFIDEKLPAFIPAGFSS